MPSYNLENVSKMTNHSTVKTWGKRLFLVLLLLAILIGGRVYYLRSTGNFHEVVAGAVFRSGQLNRELLTEKVQTFGIKSVLNLRGANPGKPWYDEEMAVCKEQGIAHYDLSLSAGKDVPPAQMEEMIAIFKNAPKPLLIHCKDGADRAALGSALYHVSMQGMAPNEAVKELTIWYGHIPMITPHVAAMGRSFWRYAESRETMEAPQK